VTYAKRGKITIVACVPCRKRKTKVSFPDGIHRPERRREIVRTSCSLHLLHARPEQSKMVLTS